MLLIRALVDRDNHLLSGEVGGPDEDGNGGPERWVRFREPGGLAQAVQTWLAGRRRSQWSLYALQLNTQGAHPGN